MQNHRYLILFISAIITIFGFLIAATSVSAATQEKVLASFDGTNGFIPIAGLVFDASGNLYGTTFSGGTNNLGAVFEVVHGRGGEWTKRTLYNFCSATGCVDGTNPQGGLVVDKAGNLYGTAATGGGNGFGAVFELVKGRHGKWKEKVLHNFNFDGADGYYPLSSLIFDSAGNLDGTTEWGGAYNSGTVFSLTKVAGHGWTEQIMYSFNDNGEDGYAPYASVIFDKAGNLYGTTALGGASGTGCGGQGCGTVFELTLGSNGNWIEAVLHSFMDDGKSGFKPWGGVVIDGSGNLYGTTNAGGPVSAGCGNGGCGVVFELTPLGGGNWSEKVLHHFQDDGSDGYGSVAGLALDAKGNLYGTTYYGGAYNDGIAFEVVPAKKRWIEKVLHTFDWSLTVKDGSSPGSGLIFDSSGNLYGTTENGGDYDQGAVIEITP